MKGADGSAPYHSGRRTRHAAHPARPLLSSHGAVTVAYTVARILRLRMSHVAVETSSASKMSSPQPVSAGTLSP